MEENALLRAEPANMEQPSPDTQHQWRMIEQEREALARRENALSAAERELSARRDDFESKIYEMHTQKLTELHAQLAQARQNSEQQLDTERTARTAQLEDELAQRRAQYDHQLAKAREAYDKQWEQERAQRRQALDTSLQQMRAALDTQIAAVNQSQQRLAEEANQHDLLARRLDAREAHLDQREHLLEEEVKSRVAQRKLSFDRQIADFADENERLRQEIGRSNALKQCYDELARRLGGDEPERVLQQLTEYELKVSNLREELLARPSLAMREEFERLKSEKEALDLQQQNLADDYENLRKRSRDYDRVLIELESATTRNKTLEQTNTYLEAHNQHLIDRLDRYKHARERGDELVKWREEIETPYFKLPLPRADKASVITEIDWLNGIGKRCADYGLVFPRRILYAFHTALKTAEWSPLTVLAGVSGTGKSELPRLYAHFGGINFMNLAVQPNWDSQEAMLGWFNVMEERFEGKPLLHLLAQSQKPCSDDYPLGLADTVSLVLMDEMNLAHVELYFAEFLSKLEQRRGMKGSDAPTLSISLGGVMEYPLQLGRNVLWAGTMNQDETTKSLSDKVLDRGIVINFPRPFILQRRNVLKPLEPASPLLPRRTWENWWCKQSDFTDEQIDQFKALIQEINQALAAVGRALGHRVWQSIEYYMANYPDVLAARQQENTQALQAAMKIAFEDQLVQKVMPKLRGIETRGTAKTECLDKIRDLLIRDGYNIIDDFEHACRFGYGQFIWSSANYLLDDALPFESTPAEQE
ncbi:chromosome partitioning protein ParA [Atlantibacter hermannii]|uniref:chromosome partitioning protein ParA n=1 Tax=Atlantibacter hermannii TaxID=565 RepID=UPI0028A87802|nr:chromosome partitioning protein ParA [Atlantibacter hermannii]